MRFLFTIMLLISSLAEGVVWETKKNWTKKEEKKYSKFIKNIDKDFFINNKINVNPDCADYVYFLRAYYSFNNNLPFHYSKEDSKISNETSLYDSYENKFVEFIKEMFLYVSTNTLLKDTYIVPFDEISIGNIYHYKIIINKKEVRHSFIIKKISNGPFFDIFYSTQAIAKKLKEGKKAKILFKKDYSINYLPNDLSGGFRAFKTSYRSEGNLPYIFNKGDKEEFNSLLIKKLKLKRISKRKRIKKTIKLLCQMLSKRETLVKESLEREKRCFNYNDYDTYSTPMLDKEIFKIINGIPLNKKINCKINNQKISRIIIENIRDQKVSSDPHQSYDVRWGLKEEEFHSCEIFY